MQTTTPRNITVANVGHDLGPAPILAVTIPDAVRISGISRAALYELAAGGRLPFAKIGRRTLIPMDGLRSLIVASTVTKPVST